MSGNVMQDDYMLNGGYISLDDGHDPLWSQERFGALIMAEQILVVNDHGNWQERRALMMHEQDRRRRRWWWWWWGRGRELLG